MKILILTNVSLLLSQVFARYMPYNNLQSKLNPLQETALNDESNQRLKDAQLFRSNDNNYLSAEDYNPGLGQSQFKDYDMNVDYGESRINEGDARLIDPRYKKGAFEGAHEHSNVGYWYPGLSRYPSRYEDSKNLAKRSSSSEEAASASQQQQQQQPSAASGVASSRKSNGGSQAAAAGAPAAAAEKRDDSSASKSENTGAAAAAASSSSDNKNEQGEISDKGASPMDVKRSSRETEEEECEEEGGEPEADADDAWYDDDEELEERQRLDRQATHLFTGGGEAKDKSNMAMDLKDKAARSLTPEDQSNPDPLAPHLSIRKRNIVYPRVRRHLGSYAYNNYDDEEDAGGTQQQHHSFESNYDANDADQYLLDYDDQGSVRRRRFLLPPGGGRRNKRQIDLTNSTLMTTTTTDLPPNSVTVMSVP